MYSFKKIASQLKDKTYQAGRRVGSFCGFYFKKICSDWPSKSQWRQFLKVLTKEEKIAFFVLLSFAISSFSFLFIGFYLKNTELQAAKGGSYIEGVVGQPRFINPIYIGSSDVDRDLVEILFSGLMKYNQEGKIIPDLAEKYEIKEGGKIYEITLREDLCWSDGSPLTSDDVIFTVKTIQNPDYKSPLRARWLGVEIEKFSNDLGIRFKLKNPYTPFLESLTLKIIPKHIWEGIPPENFPLAAYNLKPISSGPFKFQKLNHSKEGSVERLELVRDPKYFGSPPFLSKITFVFFETEKDLIKNYQRGKIQGFSSSLIEGFPGKYRNLNLYSFSLPRYFAVFLNPNTQRNEAQILSQKDIRLALNYATNKEEIIEKVLSGKGKTVNSPVLPDIYGFSTPEKIYEFNLEKAEEILDNAGFLKNEQGNREKIVKQASTFQFKSDLKPGSQGQEVKELQECLSSPPTGGPDIYPEGEITGYFGEKTEKAVIKFQEKYAKEILEPWGFSKGTGLVQKTTRTKLNELCARGEAETLPLKFSLTTTDQPVLVETAQELKSQWQKIGIQVDIKTIEPSVLTREIIQPRKYEGLLFGEVLGIIPDPFPFWHSDQKKDPGLNLAIYQNEKVDKLLEQARESQNPQERKAKLEAFQDILINDAPCIFLYSPDYLYFVDKKIKGIESEIIASPAGRFANIKNWYTETKRAWE